VLEPVVVGRLLKRRYGQGQHDEEAAQPEGQRLAGQLDEDARRAEEMKPIGRLIDRPQDAEDLFAVVSRLPETCDSVRR
jgi:hypothetical protein